jgi:putative two-component system response regulator
MRVLAIDDEPINIALLEALLQEEGYSNVVTTTDARKALPLCQEFEPDLVILDLMMPYFSGFEVMEQFATVVPADAYLPILVLTADANVQTKRQALTVGATDFLTKPFDRMEVLLRIKNLLQTRWQYLQLQRQNSELDEKVRERTQAWERAQQENITYLTKLEEAQTEMLGRLAQAGEHRDDDTGQHTYRVGYLAGLVAGKLGLSTSQVDMISRAAPLHDVGKIGISDLILLKPTRLTAEEFDIMKTHTTIGAAILAGGGSELVQTAERIALSHHERWDGRGYPGCLKGEDIPLEGRIVAIVDVFDALTNERPYKRAWSVQEAVDEIQSQRGTQFDPRVVDAFMEVVHQLLY